MPATGSHASRLRRWVAASVAVLAALAATAAWLVPYARIGAEGWLFGYPLVIMELSRQGSAQAVAPPNTLLRVRRFPDAGFKAVVRPNVDTLYTSAFIDMDAGPFVFEMPANTERYELMPFMDAWTNVFASPGTRTTGTGGGRFLLVGPRWQGAVPEGYTLLRAPTRIVWLIGRTQTNGTADYPLVHRLQDGLVLRPLDAASAPAPAWRQAPERPAPPVQQMSAMSVEDFYARFAALMVDNPPAAADAPMLEKLARIGVAPGQPPRWNGLERQAVAFGRRVAERRIAEELAGPRDAVDGWRLPPAIVGQYGDQYAVRAVAAMVGLGANLPADSIYPNATVDGTGQRLHGDHRYRLRFAPGQLPPVRAFWSVTAYGADGFLIANPLNRYALGDRDALQFGADGSLELRVQADPPTDAPVSNWLPVERGEPFALTARLYWPKPEALEGRWRMPPVQRLD